MFRAERDADAVAQRSTAPRESRGGPLTSAARMAASRDMDNVAPVSLLAPPPFVVEGPSVRLFAAPILPRRGVSVMARYHAAADGTGGELDGWYMGRVCAVVHAGSSGGDSASPSSDSVSYTVRYVDSEIETGVLLQDMRPLRPLPAAEAKMTGVDDVASDGSRPASTDGGAAAVEVGATVFAPFSSTGFATAFAIARVLRVRSSALDVRFVGLNQATHYNVPRSLVYCHAPSWEAAVEEAAADLAAELDGDSDGAVAVAATAGAVGVRGDAEAQEHRGGDGDDGDADHAAACARAEATWGYEVTVTPTLPPGGEEAAENDALFDAHMASMPRISLRDAEALVRFVTAAALRLSLTDAEVARCSLAELGCTDEVRALRSTPAVPLLELTNELCLRVCIVCVPSCVSDDCSRCRRRSPRSARRSVWRRRGSARRTSATRGCAARTRSSRAVARTPRAAPVGRRRRVASGAAAASVLAPPAATRPASPSRCAKIGARSRRAPCGRAPPRSGRWRT